MLAKIFINSILLSKRYENFSPHLRCFSLNKNISCYSIPKYKRSVLSHVILYRNKNVLFVSDVLYWIKTFLSCLQLKDISVADTS
jgi:hypothetical protein